jgi:hypothetical protein
LTHSGLSIHLGEARGNQTDLAIYPNFIVDAYGQKLNCTQRRTLRFALGQLPPAGCSWLLTTHELPASLLVANRHTRYLLDFPILTVFVHDDDGRITLHVQNDSLSKAQESGSLPAPPVRSRW